MELYNEKFKIISDVAINPRLDQFDVVHNPEGIDTDGHFMARTFLITPAGGPPVKLALLDTVIPGHIPHAVLQGHELTVILFQAIVRINFETQSIIQYVRCDNMGGLLEIHPIDQGYLIRGEGHFSL